MGPPCGALLPGIAELQLGLHSVGRVELELGGPRGPGCTDRVEADLVLYLALFGCPPGLAGTSRLGCRTGGSPPGIARFG